MLGNFFCKSTEYKQSVFEEKNVESDCPASSGDQGKYQKYVSYTTSILTN